MSALEPVGRAVQSSKPNTFVYMSEEYSAKAQFYTSIAGLEPTIGDLDFADKWTFLKTTMPRRPVTEKLYSEGGNEWPDRWMVKVDRN